MSARLPRRLAKMPTRRSAARRPRRWQGSEALAGDPALPAGLRVPRRPCDGARRAAAPAAAGRRRRRRRGPAARRRPAAGHPRRAAAPLGRLRRGRRRARRRPSGCSAPTAWPSSPPNLPALEEAVAAALAERDAALADDGAVPRRRPKQRAPCGARGRAGCARRDAAPAMPRPRRSSGSKRSATASRSAWPTSSRCSRRRAKRLPRPSGRWRLCPIRRRSSMRSSGARTARRPRHRRSPTSAPKPRPRRAKPPPTASGSSAAAREQADWRKRQADAEQRLRQAIERQEQQAAERAELRAGAGRARRRQIARARARQRRKPGRRSAKRRPPSARRSARVDRRRDAVAAANERFADARERRAAAAARAEAQQARSAEFARACVEKFECVPQRLPEKLGFDADELRDADAESATLERLTAERERIGPVNLVAEQRAGRARRSRGPRAPRKPRS